MQFNYFFKKFSDKFKNRARRSKACNYYIVSLRNKMVQKGLYPGKKFNEN